MGTGSVSHDEGAKNGLENWSANDEDEKLEMCSLGAGA